MNKMKYVTVLVAAVMAVVIGMSPIQAYGDTLPAELEDIGAELIEMGVIDPMQMTVFHQDRDGKIVITKENAGHLLNLLWALGLANKNPILEDKTEMMNPSYGGAGNFASTGGCSV